MKTHFKLKVLAVAAAMAATMPAFAAIQGGSTGNGELLLNVRYYGGGSTAATTGGDDISSLFDLGIRMDDMLALNGQAGYSNSWDLTTGAYGAAWNQLVSFVGPANLSQIEFNVIALDNTDPAVTGGNRYMSTMNVEKIATLANGQLRGFDLVEKYVEANSERGTHATDENGASVALPTDERNTFFGAIEGNRLGDNWLTKSTVDTTQPLGMEQNFWFLETSGPLSFTQVVKTPFGVDLNGDGVIGAGEFSKFMLSETGVLTFTSPVPEAETWAMMLAGLGLLGAMVRRRNA